MVGVQDPVNLDNKKNKIQIERYIKKIVKLESSKD